MSSTWSPGEAFALSGFYHRRLGPRGPLLASMGAQRKWLCRGIVPEQAHSYQGYVRLSYMGMGLFEEVRKEGTVRGRNGRKP